MTEITEPGSVDIDQLAEVARLSFIESHGHSGPPEDIRAYAEKNFGAGQLLAEMKEERSIFRIAFVNGKIAGYAKIKFDCAVPGKEMFGYSKLDRLYVAREYCGAGIGKKLFDECVQLAKCQNQKGFWLFVWTGNERALRFYNREGFYKAGEWEFRISHRHVNPNYIMRLDF